MALVCKQWDAFLCQKTEEGIAMGTLAFRREYVKQHVFGAFKWGLYFGEVPKMRLPIEVYDILRSPCPFFPGKTVKDTHIFFYMPKTVDGEPLTLNRLEKLVKNPNQRNPTQYKDFPEKIQKQYGDQAIKEPCWVLMTRDVIPGSRNQSFDAQRNLISKTKDYRIAKVSEIVIGVFLHYIATGERLLSGSPSIYTRCQEQISKLDRVVVGGFSPSGLNIRSFYFDHAFTGVVALRNFTSA